MNVARARTAEAPFATRLLRWFDLASRDLPWRRTRDPWAIWVSEVMLQQTRVEAVKAPYVRFLQRFPTPAAFAAASADDLLVAWRGLGYYRRARLLQQGARTVVERHGGSVPADVPALAELPGIGAYTRGAVASIAFGLPEVAVDGNVLRVTARHRGLRTGIDTGAGQRAVFAAVEGWLDRERPGDFNQAMMELGATVCTKASPKCAQCPVAGDCVARATDTVGELPVKKPPRAAVAVTARVVLVLDGGRALGHRLPEGGPNAGQVDLPGPGILRSVDAADVAGALVTQFAARVQTGAELARIQHAITHHRITLHAHAATLRQRGRLQWFPVTAATPWTTPARKVFAAVGVGEPEQRA
ncbi:MAG: A/G-specific adenine glycosylase [Planctomycetes bacterium]|nr:A/G-specific adenine glycosylase [Planctomycetota bacterium]